MGLKLKGKTGHEFLIKLFIRVIIFGLLSNQAYGQCIKALVSGEYFLERDGAFDIYIGMAQKSEPILVISKSFSNFFEPKGLVDENSLGYTNLKEIELNLNGLPFLKKAKLFVYERSQKNQMLDRYVYIYYHPLFLVYFVAGNKEIDNYVYDRVMECEKSVNRQTSK